MAPSPTTASHANPPRHGTADLHTFHQFFDCWLSEQNQHLQDLIAAAAASKGSDDGPSLRPLIERVLCHYEHYYRAKSHYAKHDVLSLFSPAWRSSLEDAFLWIGGWRPTMAFHLLLSKSGLQLQSHDLADLLHGFSSTHDLADLTPSQLSLLDALQRRTICRERVITEKFAKHQETVADSSMVELSHVVTEMMRHGSRSEEEAAENEERVEEALASKEEGLEEMLQMADDLRLNTLKEIVLNVLTPIQAVHFLIAAAELHLRIHEWGKKNDEDNNRHRS